MNAEVRWILSNMSDEQLLACHHRLAIYATWRCGKWTWSTGNRENLPKGFSPEAIAQEAWARLHDGERQWNYELNPRDEVGNISADTISSFTKFMRSTIDSLVYDLGHSKDHKEHASLEDELSRVSSDGDGYEDERIINKALSAFLYAPTSSPDEQLLIKELGGQIRQVLSDSAELLNLFSYLTDGLTPAEISSRMNKEPREIYVLIRRFLRRARPVYEEFVGGNGKSKSKKEER
jgi:hypothetical protein